MKYHVAYRPLPYVVALLTSLLLCIPAFSGCAQGPGRNTAASDNNPIKIAGCYSDMYYNEEGGDLLGYECFIVYSDKGYFVLYQEGAGEPTVPHLLPVTVEGHTIRFTLPPGDSRAGLFTGTLTSSELTGTFSSNGEKIVLKRKASYWQ